MKCPKCRSEMARKKIKMAFYIYQCPKCHLKIGNMKNEKTDDNDRDSNIELQTL